MQGLYMNITGQASGDYCHLMADVVHVSCSRIYLTFFETLSFFALESEPDEHLFDAK